MSMQRNRPINRQPTSAATTLGTTPLTISATITARASRRAAPCSGRRHLVDLRRQAEHQEIAVASLQPAGSPSRRRSPAGYSPRRSFFQHAVERFVVATQADHVEPGCTANGAQLQDALAEQGGVRAAESPRPCRPPATGR